MSSWLSEHQRPEKGGITDILNSNAVVEVPGEPWRWLLPIQKVHFQLHCKISTSAVAVLSMLHKERGGMGAGKTLHILRLLPISQLLKLRPRDGGISHAENTGKECWSRNPNPCSLDLSLWPCDIVLEIFHLNLRHFYSFEVTFLKFLLGLQLSFLFLKMTFLKHLTLLDSLLLPEESDAEVQNLAVALWDAASM